MPDKICKKHQVNFEDNPEFFSTVVDYNYYKKVRIKKLDTPKTLAKRILIQEHKLYPAAIIKALSL